MIQDASKCNFMKYRHIFTYPLILSFTVIFFNACEEQKARPYARIPKLGTLYGPLTAYCDMEFNDRTVDIEGDYLPHVINCENGGLD